MSETIPPHILVVDDDPQIRDLLHDYFTANELRVSVTSSGQEMTGILVDHAIDLVVLDLRLAGGMAWRMSDGCAKAPLFPSSCLPACATRPIASWASSSVPMITSP